MISCDAHIDTPWIRLKHGSLDLTQRGVGWHVDFPRMRDGGLDSAFFAIYLSDGIQDRLGPIAIATAINKMITDVRAQEDSRLVTSRAEAERAIEDALVPIFLGLEGGRLINGSTKYLTKLRGLGIRYMTLTHNFNTDWADSATDTKLHGGITAGGLAIIKHAEDIGVLIDVSHASDLTAKVALGNATKPVIASHSGCRGLVDHPRNLSDGLIRLIVETGGIICVPFASRFVGPFTVADHIDYVAQLTGKASVGIGSDLDGAAMVPAVRDVTSWREVVNDALSNRGYSDVDIAKIAGGNLLELFK